MIQHVTREITPAQLDQCISFYGQLGFAQVQAPAGIAGRAVWLQAGPTQLHLMFDPDATPQAGHVGVIVSEYDATVARLRELGHPVEPRAAHWGSPRAYVDDPAGNRVEIMAWGP
jgi:catechol 2,3-dioxygenase-like lactoylglutathione lyase family enzyme